MTQPVLNPMKERSLIAVLTNLWLAAGACAGDPNTVEVTEQKRSQTVTVRAQDLLVIRLPVQMGTGYSWRLRENSHFSLVGKEFGPASGGAPGGESDQVFRLRAVHPGTARLVLLLVQPWEADRPPQETFEVTIVIKD